MAEDVRSVPVPADAAFHKAYETPDCVLLDSSYCSMGRMIALKACKAAGWTYYDGASLLELVPELGIAYADVEAFEQGLRTLGVDLEAQLASEEYQRLRAAYDIAARRALGQGRCLIHDRVTRGFARGLGHTCVTVMSYATDVDDKRVRASRSPLYAELEPEELDRAIAEEDRIRRTWHALGEPETTWGDPATYDLMLNTDQLGLDFAAELLARLMA